QSGVSMIGTAVSTATAAGASIAGGAGGALGSAAAIATAPVTILIAGATAAVMGGYEGACYFGDERITDRAEITSILQNLSDNSDPALFALIPWGTDYTDAEGNTATADQARIRVGTPAGDVDFYDIANLYIVNSTLRNSDRGRDTVIGKVGLEVVEVEEK
ncbi:hypothetical protein, partial [Puniceibacterium antarcticum]|uniref:hypothetical protein n=1 Tax=Puniceibacterium antarcticum TaxID=1206336 RepID=UPI001C55712B